MKLRAPPQHTLLLALTIIGAASCGPDETTPSSLVPSDYATRFVEVRNCRSTIEHIATTPQPMVTNIRVLASPEAAAGYRMNAARLPVGTIIVKEEYDDPSCSRASLRAWTVMRKEAAGSDPTHNDWRWQRVRASDSALLADGRVASCIQCHNRPACTSRDWQCTEP